MAQRHLPALLIASWTAAALLRPMSENAVAAAKTPFLDSLYEKYPHTTLGASGEDVGLPDGQMGNSEGGSPQHRRRPHRLPGASRINNAPSRWLHQENEVFVKGLWTMRQADDKTLHLMGLMSPAVVHSHMNHVEALVKMAAERVKTVRIHAFMDGQDVDPVGRRLCFEFCAFLAKVSRDRLRRPRRHRLRPLLGHGPR